MTEREQVLYDWLHQACGLIAIEARDHEDGRVWDDREQRRNIAKVLRRFLRQATNVLDDAKETTP